MFVLWCRKIDVMKTHRPANTKSPLLITFGDSVRIRRKELGFSQEAFGDVCGIDRSYMGRIERGEHNPTLVSIMKIVENLNMEPSEFFKVFDGKE